MRAPVNIQPPANEPELVARARAIAGRRIGDVAGELGIDAPRTLERHKGFVGELLERALGATAGSRDEPDFPKLGVELKSIPVDRRGKPRESTFVCTMPLSEIADLEWGDSRVARKLSRVLFMPVESDRELMVGARRIGAPVLWTPSPEQTEALARDWADLAGLVGAGEVERITAHLGVHLQVRPKAAHSRIRTSAPGGEDGILSINPRGFYLRATFTQTILTRAFS